MSSSSRSRDNEEHQQHQKHTTTGMDMDMDEVKTSSRLEVAQQAPARDSLLSWLAPSFWLGSTSTSTSTAATIEAPQNPIVNSPGEHLVHRHMHDYEYDKPPANLTAAKQQQMYEDRGIQDRPLSLSSQQQKKRGTPHRGPTPTTCTKRRQRSSPFHQQQQSLLSLTAPSTVRKQAQKPKQSSSNNNNNLNDSVDTHDSNHSDSTTSQSNSNFRFTAFPASLPRIGAPTGNRLVPSATNSFDNEGDHNQEDDHDFNRDVDDYYDDNESTLLGTSVTQARLNFNEGMLMDASTQTSTLTKCRQQNFAVHGGMIGNTEKEGNSSDKTGNIQVKHDREADLARPYETQRVHSFASTVSSVTKNNLSESFCGEENITSSTAGLTPSRAGSVTEAAPLQPHHVQLSHHPDMVHHEKTPDSPHETVPLHYYLQMNTVNCSPIPGIPEEDDVEQLSMDGASHHSTRIKSTSKRPHKTSSVVPSRSNDGASGGTSVRPMPDMNAFDGVGNDTMTQSTSLFLNASGDRCSTEQQFLCPPTPARTPAWAVDNDDDPAQFILFTQRQGIKKKKFERQNSLIATKVLATCSPQVLDSRASLEEISFLDEKSDNSSVLITTEEPMSHSSCGSNNNGTTNQRRVSSGTTVTTTSSHQKPVLAASRSGDLTWLHHSQGQRKVDLDHPDLDDDVNDYDDDDEEHEIVLQHRQLASRQHPVVSMADSFDVLSTLGRGNFADVYKVRSKRSGLLYAVKRVRQQFRGKRDREAALAEVKTMQRLQSHVASTALSEQQEQRTHYHSLYLLFFFQAWQEEGHFYCLTELCCRVTCREMMDALRSHWHIAKTIYPSLSRLPESTSASSSPGSDVGRLMPEDAIWKICHDVGAGLSYIHSHGIVHNDIKPSNIFFVRHPRIGALCKIGDFGMARSVGCSEDGQEGDQKYMALELLKSRATMHPLADIFSLGMTLYEMASNLFFVLPCEGSRWHEVRSDQHMLDVPSCRSVELQLLIRRMIHPTPASRPSADITVSSPAATTAGREYNRFLHDYIRDVEEWEKQKENDDVLCDGQTPRQTGRAICSPTFGFSVPVVNTSPAHSN